MKRKRFSVLLCCALALAILVGLMLPIASAQEVVIEFLNPLAELEPMDNMPVASREPLRNKLKNNEDISIVLVTYAKAANPEMMLALATVLKEALESSEFGDFAPDLEDVEYTGNVTIYYAGGGTQLNATGANGTVWSGSTHAAGNGYAHGAAHYWKNQNDGLGRPPFLGNPWGPKTGYGFTGMPFYEQMFDRYANWASHDIALVGIAD